jgi:hypothetical protein
MLIPEPLAATTPFVKGSVRLPSVTDCHRILSRTRRAYLTAPPQPGKFRDPNRTVEKTVTEVARLVQLVPGKYGHVRLRGSASELRSQWTRRGVWSCSATP